MSLLYKNDNLSIIDHYEFMCKIYSSVNSEKDDNSKLQYKILQELFSINKNLNEKTRRKRRHDSDIEIEKEAKYVLNVFETALNDIPSKLKNKIEDYNISHTNSVRNLSKELFEATIFDHEGISGGNNLGEPLIGSVKGERFLLPSNSRFLSGCIMKQCKKLEGSKYNMLIADPPWWNKYIRRLKGANQKMSYNMMYNEDIASIPIKGLLSPNSLIAVWCTNSPSNINAVKDIIFPKWGVEYVTTWYWLKITTDWRPVCEFGVGNQKQPFERLMLGKIGDCNEMEDRKVVVSVPCALQSNKPPLIELLSPYLKQDPVPIELFARNLLPNTTSVGHEPLKWQHLSLYQCDT